MTIMVKPYPNPHRTKIEADAACATALIRSRRMRDDAFPDLFADPRWNMMLALFAAHAEGHRLTVVQVCDAGPVPVATGLRHNETLSARGLLRRRRDSRDRRKTYISLTMTAMGAMRQSLAAWLQATPQPRVSTADAMLAHELARRLAAASRTMASIMIEARSAAPHEELKSIRNRSENRS